MKTTFVQWIISHSRRMLNSIAFLPTVISLLFLAIAIAMVYFDYSELGKDLKARWNLLRLQDASTARTIVSAIAAGIISLTVFSFSMVMIVLNQAASQMSNRILDNLIGNRFQQLVLGFYIGTIVYALFLLSTIRDIDSGIYVPALSTYLLIILTVLDIYLFIYFLHYITQSVKYKIIIKRIHNETEKSIKHTCRLDEEPDEGIKIEGQIIKSPTSGIFTGFDKDGLLKSLKKRDGQLSFKYPIGGFVLKDAPFMTLSSQGNNVDQEWFDELMLHIFITKDESIEEDFNFGLRQLMEVAVKALSPGVNDPGTAVTSIRAIADLLAYRLKHFPSNVIRDEKGKLRIMTREPNFEQIFIQTLYPIWDYGKNDRMVQLELNSILVQIQEVEPHPSISKLLVLVRRQMATNEH